MPNGTFWTTVNGKPKGEFDPDEIMRIPFSFVDWLAGIGSTYFSHSVLYDALTFADDGGTHTAGVIVVELRKEPTTGVLGLGNTYPVTVRCVAVNGESTDLTGYLKMVTK